MQFSVELYGKITRDIIYGSVEAEDEPSARLWIATIYPRYELRRIAHTDIAPDVE